MCWITIDVRAQPICASRLKKETTYENRTTHNHMADMKYILPIAYAVCYYFLFSFSRSRSRSLILLRHFTLMCVFNVIFIYRTSAWNENDDDKWQQQQPHNSGIWRWWENKRSPNTSLSQLTVSISFSSDQSVQNHSWQIRSENKPINLINFDLIIPISMLLSNECMKKVVNSVYWQEEKKIHINSS